MQRSDKRAMEHFFLQYDDNQFIYIYVVVEQIYNLILITFTRNIEINLRQKSKN